MKNKFCFIFLSFIFLIMSFVSAALNVSLSNQGTDVTTKSTGELLAFGDIQITVWDSLTGGNLIYNETFVNAIISGSWNVMLGENSSNSLPLEFGEIYYYDYEIDGSDIDFTNLSGDTIERQFFYSPLGDISDEDISDTTNLTLGQKITFTFEEVIDNIINGWVRITGGLNVTNDTIIGGDLNISGNATISGTSLTVSGTEVCLADGANCQGAGSYYFNKTGTSYTANLSSGGYVGYKAGNYICDQEFSGTHLCYESEVVLTIGNNNISAMSQWSDTAWIISGGAKYSPASLPVNDCEGFTHGTAGDYLGSFWMFNQTDGGAGGVGHCANSLPLACCKAGGIS